MDGVGQRCNGTLCHAMHCRAVPGHAVVGSGTDAGRAALQQLRDQASPCMQRLAAQWCLSDSSGNAPCLQRGCICMPARKEGEEGPDMLHCIAGGLVQRVLRGWRIDDGHTEACEGQHCLFCSHEHEQAAAQAAAQASMWPASSSGLAWPAIPGSAHTPMTRGAGA